MSNFTIYELKKEQNDLLNTIFKLYQQTFDPSLKIPQRDIRKFIKNDIYTTNYILDKDKNLCGYCFHMYLEEINAVEIDYIAIHPNYQGKGLARLLFDYIYNTYCNIRKNFRILTLECEDNLIGFYIKLGCKIIPVKYEVGCKHHLNIMVKSNESIKLNKYHKIINAIKKENDYSEPINNQKMLCYYKKVMIKICIKSNKERESADLNSYNYYTKEGIS